MTALAWATDVGGDRAPRDRGEGGEGGGGDGAGHASPPPPRRLLVSGLSDGVVYVHDLAGLPSAVPGSAVPGSAVPGSTRHSLAAAAAAAAAPAAGSDSTMMALRPGCSADAPLVTEPPPLLLA